MRSGIGDLGIKTAIINRLVPTLYLRFCPACLTEDLSKYGEAYWHRLHQAPGVMVCPVHEEVLLNSSVPKKTTHEYAYVAARPENCKIPRPSSVPSKNTMRSYVELANDATWLLNNNLTNVNSNWLQQQYLVLLIIHNLCRPTARYVRNQKLLDSFRSFYGEEFLAQDPFGVESEEWLARIVRKPRRKGLHPMKHLMLMRLLTGGIDRFFRQEHVYKPFGDGPWPCLNGAAAHYKESVVTDLAITICYENRSEPVGIFSCSCGFVYSRRGPDRNDEDQYRIGSVRDYGHIWKQKLTELVEENPHLTAFDIGSILNVNRSTVRKHAKILNLKTRWKCNTDYVGRRDVSEDQRLVLELYRNQWQDLRAKHPDAPKKTLRELAPHIYAYLYRLDREWLKSNSPTSKPAAGHFPVTRVNWEERDSEMLNQVKQIVAGLQACSLEKPKRITVYGVLMLLGYKHVAKRHFYKVPRTKAYLELVAESMEDYQIRKVKWAVKQLGSDLKPWKIVQKATLRRGYSEKVRRAIEEVYNGPRKLDTKHANLKLYCEYEKEISVKL